MSAFVASLLLAIPANCAPIDFMDVAKGGWDAIGFIKDQFSALAKSLEDYHDELFWVLVVFVGLLIVYFCYKMFKEIILCLVFVAIVFVAATVLPGKLL